MRSRGLEELASPLDPAAQSNSWAASFKGWFWTGDGLRCEPSTVTEGYSSCILSCSTTVRITMVDIQPTLTGLFRAHGLPRPLPIDDGSTFANRQGLAG
jgi:transposase InsO family protein